MEMKTKNASIDTMAVTIQALHVSGKMMTQSVFKQLPEFDLFLHRIDLIASMELWGMVSYRIKHGGNLWLIGSKDGIMYRIDTTNIYPRPGDEERRKCDVLWERIKKLPQLFIAV